MSKQGKGIWWLLAGIVMVGVAGAAWVYFARPQWPSRGTHPPAAPREVTRPAAAAEKPATQLLATQPATDPSTQPASQPATAPASMPALSNEDASAAYQRGMELMRRERFVEARNELNSAYWAGTLPPEKQKSLRQTLSDLAEMTLTGRGTPAFEEDPYVLRYQIQGGDVLARVERKLELHVPPPLIVKVNGLSRAEDLQAGQTYKMVRGPFHAMVDKASFTMDIYLQRDGLPRVFVRRLKVGTGKNDTTPAGLWRVRLGGKEVHPTWFPPPNSPLRGPVPYGHANYAFGVKGLWISLEGLDEQTHGLSDYGIHSTNDPASIGQAGSLGCIRLSDEDIELVFMLLYEHWSTVDVR